MPARSARDRFFTCFATCAPGVEPILHAEARELGLARLERQVGGVRFEGTLADVWSANLALSTAVRVLLRLARFPAENADALYRGVAALDWGAFLRPEGTLVVSAQTKESRLDHSEFIEQRTKDAIVDGFRARGGIRPSVDKDDPDLAIHVHLFRDRATLSLDSSGESLHKRGWRVHQGRSPLAETLAAALLRAANWDLRSPLVDPFCGSGTILIEAALRASSAASGARRRFGFERWLGHDAHAFTEARRAREARRVAPRRLALAGSDLDPDQVQGARENAVAAGVGELVRLEAADARAFAPRRGWNGWVVTNLPYGRRVGADGRRAETGAELAELYREFGARLREHCTGYTLALLAERGGPTRELGLEPERRLALANGGLDCELILARL
jgi:putative N6-adenine-specific DNA methylase